MFFILISLFSFHSIHPEEANPFENLFKDVDWDQLAQDMEKIFKEIEEEEEGEKPVKKESTTAQTSGKETGKPSIDTSKLNDYELFTNPVVEKEKKTGKPWIAQASLDASKRLFKKFNDSLQSIIKKIMADPDIGPDYKEELMAYDGFVGLFSTSAGIITSKTLYQKILLQPSTEKGEQKSKDKLKDDMKTYRELFVNQLKKVQKFDEQIKAPTLKKELEDIQGKKVRELAKQPTKKTDEEEQEEAVTKFKTGKRGKKSKKAPPAPRETE